MLALDGLDFLVSQVVVVVRLVEESLPQDELSDLADLFVKEDEKADGGSLERMRQLADELVTLL